MGTTKPKPKPKAEPAAIDGDVVWEGADALQELLVPIETLEPFPGNPRRGDVAVVRESLDRFGQVRAVLLDGDKPTRIVAGHHVVLAAADKGWTHVAAHPAEFGGEEGARAYLLADNRTHDRGDYDVRLLHAQLEAVRATEAGLAGTGYSDDYALSLERELEAMRLAAQPPPEFPPINPDELETEYRCPSCSYEWSGSPKPGGPE